MYTLNQNKKILLSAAILFALSFAVMIFFLQRYSHNLDHGQTNVLSHSSEIESEAENGHESEDQPWMEHISDHDLAFVTSPDGRFVFASESFKRMLNLPDDYEDSLLFDFLDSEDLSVLVNAQTDLIQSAEAIDSIGPLELEGKTEVLVLLNASPILNNDEYVEYIVFEVYDLTEKIDDLKEKKEGSSEDNINPRLEEIPDDAHHRFTVEKIGYQSE